jgi:hypothetical protein
VRLGGARRRFEFMRFVDRIKLAIGILRHGEQAAYDLFLDRFAEIEMRDSQMFPWFSEAHLSGYHPEPQRGPPTPVGIDPMSQLVSWKHGQNFANYFGPK